MECMEAIYDLQLEISVTPEGPEREELERTLTVCREIIYMTAEGFFEIEEIDDGDDYRIYPVEECFHAELIEA